MPDSQPRRTRWSVLLGLVVVGLVIGAITLLVGGSVTLDDARRFALAAADTARSYPVVVFGGIALAQGVANALSLPLKAVLTVLGGALLGAVWGTAASMLGVAGGTSILFVVVRRVLRERFQAAAGPRARALEARLARRPIRAMAGMRLIVTLPYGPISIAAALTSIRYRDFLAGSVLGDLPVIALYAFAGRQLMELESLSDVLSPLTLAVLLGAAALFLATVFLGGRRDPLVAPPVEPESRPPEERAADGSA